MSRSFSVSLASSVAVANPLVSMLDSLVLLLLLASVWTNGSTLFGDGPVLPLLGAAAGVKLPMPEVGTGRSRKVGVERGQRIEAPIEVRRRWARPSSAGFKGQDKVGANRSERTVCGVLSVARITTVFITS